jgi:hypothetical protein
MPGRCRCAPPAPPWSRTCTRTNSGPKGTYLGAIIANGNLYCPRTPLSLPELGPLARDASRDDIVAHGPYHQWTRKKNGRTSTRILTDDQLADYGAWFDNHRRLRELITELEALSLAIAEADPRWNR